MPLKTWFLPQTFLNVIVYYLSKTVDTITWEMPRHNLFSNQQMRDMVFTYAKKKVNGCNTHYRYLKKYPNRERGDRLKLFRSLYGWLDEVGSFCLEENDLGCPKTIRRYFYRKPRRYFDLCSRKPWIRLSKVSVLRIFH